MKIAILTHPLGTNYGGILQAYALSEYLKKKRHEVIVLNRQANLPLIKRLTKSLLITFHHPRYNPPKYRRLAMFVNKHINYSKRLYTSNQMKNYITSNNFDLVIVGSDQVWRADFAMNYDYNYFLDFVPANMNKFAYAASFGLSDWHYTKEQTDVIKHLVTKFNAASVREDEGVTLCKEHLGINAELVLDPTMLLYPEDYAIVTSPRQEKGNYVFVYWLGTIEEKQKALAESDIENKKIIDISTRASDTLISVEDWLSYIKYADHVITDSFHGCVFSILFQKQFTICKNDSGGNGRLKSLFKILDIDPSAKHIDYIKVADALCQKRNLSNNFIQKTIS